MSIAEIHRHLLRILTFCLEKITICLYVGKGHEGDFVRQEMSIWHRAQGIDMQGVAPDGIDAGVRLRRRHKRVVSKGQHLSSLCETEIIIHILQGVGTVSAGGDTLYHEMATAVSTGDT